MYTVYVYRYRKTEESKTYLKKNKKRKKKKKIKISTFSKFEMGKNCLLLRLMPMARAINQTSSVNDTSLVQLMINYYLNLSNAVAFDQGEPDVISHKSRNIYVIGISID